MLKFDQGNGLTNVYRGVYRVGHIMSDQTGHYLFIRRDGIKLSHKDCVQITNKCVELSRA